MKYGLYLGLLLLYACGSETNTSDKLAEKKDSIAEPALLPAPAPLPDTTDLEYAIRAAGLIEVRLIDSTIRVELKYSTTDNFMGMDLYGDFDRLYLQPDVARKLREAQAYLKAENPSLSLLVYDGVRPRSVQQKMWDTLDMPAVEKGKFVSNPQNGSLHNFGAAVDITLVGPDGQALDMGTPYDFIGELAYPRLEARFLQEGKLSQAQLDNRLLLRKVMHKAGFTVLPTEWWHFNSCSREEARRIYKIVE